MPKHNRNFELTVNDIDLIEAALRTMKRDLSFDRLDGLKPDLPDSAEDDPLRQIHDLLGRLHNQKTFYRPMAEPYVGG
ncbi:hypothetical protein [Sulfitobacter sabulilitoris]|uniref:Uncharacterized protein n=1 Tax=Sulfitobacter sabulilitoris TaxID=2562655 RepID=A0A5S3PBB5_9RHOB|nr:hypothetical protein [Sulfitobacter sabulilitoris]TMM50861.1 hypothetical protein FDT80_16530 [Sulfitobacter sabulilitoris]